METAVTVQITSYEEAREAYRQKDLRQALYDDGEVVMADVLVNLHGEDHLARRRLENRLFRREHLERYEREMFPPVIDATLSPHVQAGEADLVKLGHQMMMNLAAVSAGVDRPRASPEETFDLYRYLMRFIEGATLAHFTGDKAAKRDEIHGALVDFDEEFLQPSIARRRRLLGELEAGALAEADLPLDVLTILLRNQDNLSLPHEVVRREVAFFLLASAHTSATAYTRTIHNVLTWLRDHPEDAARVAGDRLFVQRCVHETVRLEPSSPVGMRWALAPIELKTGLSIPEGAKVVIDLMAVNRDPVFGDDAASFNPYRALGDLPPYGLSFGGGVHACIGQVMAGGHVAGGEGVGSESHLYGLVSGAVQATFDAGVRAHPTGSPERDANTKRPYWGRYPVVFA